MSALSVDKDERTNLLEVVQIHDLDPVWLVGDSQQSDLTVVATDLLVRAKGLLVANGEVDGLLASGQVEHEGLAELWVGVTALSSLGLEALALVLITKVS